MERENLFLVLAILLMLIIMTYEAFATDKKALVFGNYYGSNDKANRTELKIDGVTLPPLVEYRNALKKALRSAMMHAASSASKRDSDNKESASRMVNGFSKYYDKAFSRFMFDLNSRGRLTSNLVPKSNPVSTDDIEYYMNTFGLKEYAHMVTGARIPTWPKFNETGPRVNAVYSELSGTLKNSITGIEFEITPIQYQRLREIYIGPPELFDNIAYTVLYVYFNLGGLGNNGSVPIGTIDESFIELFGSPLNTQQRYCSPFAFEKDYFGSLGSFFDYRLVPNQKYTCNPPYVDNLMAAAATHVTAELKRLGSGSNVSMLVVIPVWDLEGLESIGETKPNDANKYEKYATREIIESSPFVRAKKTLNKRDHEYYSWYGNKYVSYSHTYLYVLSTEETPSIDLDSLVARWDAIVALGPPTSLDSYKQKITGSGSRSSASIDPGFALDVGVSDEIDSGFVIDGGDEVFGQDIDPGFDTDM